MINDKIISPAIIGGTGIDEMDEFSSGNAVQICTRFGNTDIFPCKLGDQEFIFLPRHGIEHSLPPGLINYKAQIAALKKIGIKHVIGVCAVGSLTTELLPGSFAVLSDFIDMTKHRDNSFYNEAGVVVHTDFTYPYCPQVSGCLGDSCKDADVQYMKRAVYVGVDGPRYETPIEIKLYSSWGGHVIGMTNVPEVILAKEAGLCYGAIAVVTNLASGLSPVPLRHEEVRAAVLASGKSLEGILKKAIASIAALDGCNCSAGSQLSV